MAAAAGLLVSLPQMVELAIGSPEIGAVNFNLLGAALQVIIQQLKLDAYTVDFRGPDVERMQGLLATAKPGMSLKISEPVDLDSTTIGKEEAISTTDPRRSSREEPKSGSIKRNEKVIVVEPSSDRRISTLPHVVVGVSQELFVQINDDVEELKNKMNELLQLPNDQTLLEAVRAKGQDKVTPVIDMWQALSIAKRLESAETGMEKLAGLFENLIKEIGGQDGGGNILADIGGRIEALEQRVGEIEAGRGSVGGRGSGSEGGSSRPARGSKEGENKGDIDAGDFNDLITDVESLKSKIKSMEGDFSNIMKGAKGKNLGDLFRDVEELKNKKPSEEDGEGEEGEEGGGGGKGGIDEAAMNELEEKFAEMNNKLDNLDESYSGQIAKLEEQLLNIEKELGVLLEGNNTKSEAVTDVQSMGDLFKKLVKVQEDIDNINKNIDKIQEDQDERTLTMEALTEQLEVLKTTKADREDLEDALAEKADTQQVNRKVSTIQFDAACEGLTRHIEETVKKLSEQEEMWQATLVELQMTIGYKLDKQEFDPLRDFVNKKIKSLQQRLKALLAMKQEQEAAGTKSKILKNVNCISCDKDVIMYKENKFSTFPQPASMPGNRSIKPYITYELDAVRKQQKSLPGRNMNHLESAIQEDKSKKDKPADKALPAGHLCNRYCGGSHTMTQPQQRVAHIGHFLNQWGPQAIPLDEGIIMGSDGQMYKARDGGDAPKAPSEDLRRLSAQMQTDEPKERVARMSSQLDAIRRSRTKSGPKPSATSELEPVKEEIEEKKERKSSSAKLRKSSSDNNKPKGSTTARTSSPRVSKKSTGSLKRSLKDSLKEEKKDSLKQSLKEEKKDSLKQSLKEPTPAREEEAPPPPPTAEEEGAAADPTATPAPDAEPEAVEHVEEVAEEPPAE